MKDRRRTSGLRHILCAPRATRGMRKNEIRKQKDGKTSTRRARRGEGPRRHHGAKEEGRSQAVLVGVRPEILACPCGPRAASIRRCAAGRAGVCLLFALRGSARACGCNGARLGTVAELAIPSTCQRVFERGRLAWLPVRGERTSAGCYLCRSSDVLIPFLLVRSGVGPVPVQLVLRGRADV